ncbi:MAG: Dehydrogenase, partial [Phenylobacterium sp.]|nr:Dehydrogenase [Phenylobacterium sp.]
GGKAEYFHHDVTDEAAWESVIAQVKARHGRLDILVNNAGIAISGSVVEMSLADWRRQTAVNLDGVFLGVKHAIPLMRASGAGGSIINMSSVAGLKGAAGLAGYSATKGGVRLFTKAVALECANAKDGIRVNSVHPGLIETPIWLSVGEAMSPGANAPPDLDAMSAMAVPLGVKGFPEDIANGVLWLASDESRYVTGQELVIDGGLTVR